MLLALALSAGVVLGDLVPGTEYDPAIPTPADVLGYTFGERITPPAGIGRYLEALAQAAPERARLIRYGETWEGRPLQVLAIGSAGRMAHLDQVTAGLRKLADPRGLDAGAAERLVDELPVVVLLMHAVHGNEISSSDAALAEAYHLLAARGEPAAERILANAIVLIDPLQNPDGRARFVHQNLLGQAATPDPDPVSIEHDEPWPGGRANHYLFDMNRDWFALTQAETRARVALYQEWYPHVVVDLHEMGGESTYYFAPPAIPENPYVTDAQKHWWDVIGRANAEAFDSRGYAYFVREVYDSFYPGYGESWPIFQGAVGMTYEQASPRGLRYRRHDGSEFGYAEAVAHHFVAALTTADTAARQRARLLGDFLDYRRSASAEGRGRAYVIAPGPDPSRSARLARLLGEQGVDVRRTQGEVAASGRRLPAGSWVVPLDQPAGRLVRNLLEPRVAMDPGFVAEQDRRRKARLSDEIYDVTAWSLPLLFDVDVVEVATPAQLEPVSDRDPAGPADLPPARVGYLVPWGSAAASLLADAHREGLRVRSAGRPFSIAGHGFERGTLLFRTADNPADLAARLGGLVARHGAQAVPVDSGWVDSGISLGSREFRVLEPRRVVLAWDEPTSSLSAGWARYVLERRFSQPVTAVRVESLDRLDLDRCDVLVLPSGDYSDVLGKSAVERLSSWIGRGGTLITLAEASRWAARKKVGLLETRTELRDGRPELDASDQQADADAKASAQAPAAPFVLEKAILPEDERPEAIPGALLRVELDPEHWLGFGTDGEVQAVVESRRIFTPIRLDDGRNAGVYADADRLVASGLAWPEARASLAHKAYLIDQTQGDGHLVAFAEDPNYRAFSEATELLFMNAVLLSGGY